MILWVSEAFLKTGPLCVHLHYLAAPSRSLNSRHLLSLGPHISGTLCRASIPYQHCPHSSITWRFSGRVYLPLKVWREVSLPLFCPWSCMQHAEQSCWVLVRPFINFSWRRFHVLDWQFFWGFTEPQAPLWEVPNSLGLWWNWFNPLDNSFLVFQGKEFHSWWVHFEWNCAVMEKTCIYKVMFGFRGFIKFVDMSDNKNNTTYYLLSSHNVWGIVRSLCIFSLGLPPQQWKAQKINHIY